MKKQMAIFMSAITTMGVALPAVASADIISTNDAEAISRYKQKVKELMKLSYVDDKNKMFNQNLADKKVYVVKINGETTNIYSAFEREFDNVYDNLENGEVIRIAIESVGGFRKLANGDVVDTKESNKYEMNANGQLTLDGTVVDSATEDKSAQFVGDYEVSVDSDGTYSYKIKLSDYNGDSERFIELTEGMEALDTKVPMLKVVNDFYVDKDDNPVVEKKDGDILSLDALGKIGLNRENENVNIDKINSAIVDGFENVKAKADVDVIKDAISKDVTTIEFKAQDFYDVNTGRLTQAANNTLVKLGKDYNVNFIDQETLAYTDSNHKMIAKIKILKDSGDKDGKAFNFLTKTPALQEISRMRFFPEYLPQFAGRDRYETSAIVAKGMVSREGANSDTVVLVSGDSKSMVDGLTAAPYAHSLQKDGRVVPVLLTKKDKLHPITAEYLKDNNVKHIKIVGGEGSVSNELVEQIKNEIVITDIERISGASRFETAMEVADEINENTKDNNQNAIVVSGYSVADSLSIAGIAASKGTPILLSKKDELSKRALDFMDEHTNKKIFIIGGENSVSKNVTRKILSEVDGSSINRTSGENRQETNAEVIKDFTPNSKGVVIARGDGNGLVDALSAGAFVGNLGDCALVLTGKDGMNKNQKDNIGDYKYPIQIGYSVSYDDAKYLFENAEY